MKETATVCRKTRETDVQLTLSLRGGAVEVQTGVGFLDHMLTLFAAHGGFGLRLACEGDTRVDDHHTVEDCGIALGMAFAQALEDGRGITRYGSFLLPMDEALVLVALDISGRCHLTYAVMPGAEKVGAFEPALAREFLLGLCRAMGLTLHARQLAGENAHHILEALFKALGRALAMAVAPGANGPQAVPSTKGLLL